MGATVGNDGTRFTVWAPNAHRVEVVIEEGPHAGTLALQPDANGVHTGFGSEVPAGIRFGAGLRPTCPAARSRAHLRGSTSRARRPRAPSGAVRA